jgi:MFS family permease
LALEVGGGRIGCFPPNGRSASPAAERSLPQAKAALARPGARGLDWFTFFLSDIQTGFGPFVAIYLTAHHWAQFDIGLVLTTGGLIALAAQIPGGALVDAARSARALGAVAVAAIGVSALALAIWPTFPVVIGSRVLHAGASCVLGPVIAALSLGLVGHAALGERLGRNARFASLGNGIAAGTMGLCGYFLSNQAVFYLTAAFVLPALWALARIPATRETLPAEPRRGSDASGVGALLSKGQLFVFAGCILLFQLANAAMLPLMGSMMSVRAPAWATGLMGACIVVPQLVVVAIAPALGRLTDSWGRKPLLSICFLALAVRGVMFALVSNPYAVVFVQALDGVSAAIMGVTLPLVVADLTRDTGRFNLALGIAGSAVGVGAALSTTLAGYTTDHFGSTATFYALASIAASGLALLCLLFAETRPRPGRASSGRCIQSNPSSVALISSR